MCTNGLICNGSNGFFKWGGNAIIKFSKWIFSSWHYFHWFHSWDYLVEKGPHRPILTQPITYTHARTLDRYIKAIFRKQPNKLLGTFDPDPHIQLVFKANSPQSNTDGATWLISTASTYSWWWSKESTMSRHEMSDTSFFLPAKWIWLDFEPFGAFWPKTNWNKNISFSLTGSGYQA